MRERMSFRCSKWGGEDKSWPKPGIRRWILAAALAAGAAWTAVLILFAPPAFPQSGPDAERDISLTVTTGTTSSGSAAATNTSDTWHYKGELKCVSTCPGPDPNGCSITDWMTADRELAPDQTASCIMFGSTDPCCQDDGNFVLGAKFTASDYRASANDPWTPFSPEQVLAESSSNEDAGQGHPDPNPNKPVHAGQLELTVTCANPFIDPNNPDQKSGGVEEAKVTVQNTSKRNMFKVKLRGAAACPSDRGEPAICNCELGWCKSYSGSPACTCAEPGVAGTGNCDPNVLVQSACADDPNGEFRPDCTPYPRTFDAANSNQIVWTQTILLMDEGSGDSQSSRRMSPLSTCCDVRNSRNRLVCGELDTLEVKKPGNDWQQLNSPGYDKTGKCTVGDIESSKNIDCFEGFLTDPDDPNVTDPSVLCSSPI